MNRSEQPFLPYGRQCIDDEDISEVARVLRSDFLTTGPEVLAFEEALAAACDAAFAIACSSGTAALHLAAMALRLGPGDVVIVPALTFLATANAVRYVGAEVVFADVDPETGLMQAEHLERALQNPRAASARAVFPVHLNGPSVDMAALERLARSRDLAIVEDACHAIGGRQTGKDRPVGCCAYSDMAVFSFHPVKTVTMGEGGAITTNDHELAERLGRLGNHGMMRDAAGFADRRQSLDEAGLVNPWYYEMPEVGFNYRATDFQCALGRSQLKKLKRFVDRRRELARHYDALLAPLAPILRRVSRHDSDALHLYAVRIDFQAAGMSRAELMGRLRALGIGTQVHYLPVNRQPYYAERYGRDPLPGADAYYEQCLSLPLFVGMADGDVERVAEGLFSLLRARGAQ